MTRLLILGLTACILAPGSAWAARDEVTETYQAGFAGDTDTDLCAENDLNPTGENIGVVCFDTLRRNVEFRIDDATGQTVMGAFVFLDAQEQPLGSAIFFCGQSSRALIPDDARTARVYIGGPAFGALECLLDGPGDTLGTGTVGTMTASFGG